jgi:hypothetical protein
MATYCEGLHAEQHSNTKALNTLAAIAVMLDEATKKTPSKKREKKQTKDFDSGKALYDMLREKAGDALVYEPATPGSFASVGKSIRQANITLVQLDTLARWLASGPFEWRNNKPTWGEFTRKAVDWVAQATTARPPRHADSAAIKKLRDQGGL